MKTAQLEVVYENHMGSDLMVVNAARVGDVLGFHTSPYQCC